MYINAVSYASKYIELHAHMKTNWSCFKKKMSNFPVSELEHNIGVARERSGRLLCLAVLAWQVHSDFILHLCTCMTACTLTQSDGAELWASAWITSIPKNDQFLCRTTSIEFRVRLFLFIFFSIYSGMNMYASLSPKATSRHAVDAFFRERRHYNETEHTCTKRWQCNRYLQVLYYTWWLKQHDCMSWHHYSNSVFIF